MSFATRAALAIALFGAGCAVAADMSSPNHRILTASLAVGGSNMSAASLQMRSSVGDAFAALSAGANRMRASFPAQVAGLLSGSPYDSNDDGRPDLAWSHTPSGATFFWYMNGPVLISDEFVTGIDPSWKVQGIADFNGDGHPDLLWRNTANGNTYVWYMNGPSLISDAFLFALPPLWLIQGVADLNGDGKPDLFMRHAETGVGFAWYFDDNVAIGDDFLFGIDPSWKVEQVADLDGDGQPDLLFRSMTSGLAFAWYTQASGGRVSLGASSQPIFAIDPVWEIVQLADWNGDANADLVFRNRDSGLVFVWYLNGTTLGASDFVTQIDPSWEIVPRR